MWKHELHVFIAASILYCIFSLEGIAKKTTHACQMNCAWTYVNALATNALSVEATLQWLIVIKFSHFNCYYIPTMFIILPLYHKMCVLGIIETSYDFFSQLANSVDINSELEGAI